MINHIVLYTNMQIDKVITEFHDEVLERGYSCYVTNTCAREMRAFIGLLYARGLLNASHQTVRYMFNDDIGHPIFGATMSSKRFVFLNANIRFDNIHDRVTRFPQDRFAAMRELFEMFNTRCSSVLQPNEYLALDETLYGCRNQISFKQYNSSKPQKYGLLFKSVNAVTYPFTFRACVYSGKPTGEAGPYYVPGILPTVQSLVSKLETHVDLRGRNITMDRLYTSFELAE